MLLKSTLTLFLLCGLALACGAEPAAAPPELAVIEASLGVWDATIEVWPQGPAAPSLTFQGVETNRPHGKHWLASDFDSEFAGQTMQVHSIIGYDLDKKQLVGLVVDHGPYAATMTGQYDPATKTVHWTTQAKNLDGSPLVQQTQITHESPDERVLVLSMPKPGQDAPVKFMQIRFVRRK